MAKNKIEIKSEDLKPEVKAEEIKIKPEPVIDEVAASQEVIGQSRFVKKSITNKNEPIGLFKKVFKGAHGNTKHYQKFGRNQIEKTNYQGFTVMVFEDNGQECPCFENLSQGVINNFELF